MLLDLHHEVVEVDELGADGQAAERGLVQDFVEAVVVLDELRQGALREEDVTHVIKTKHITWSSNRFFTACFFSAGRIKEQLVKLN